MEASELRIGNYYRQIALGEIARVNLFTFSEWQNHIDCDDDSFGDWMSPIPLTEEWLSKFGLKGTSTEGISTFDDIENESGDTYWWEKRIKRSITNDGFSFTIVRWGIDGEFTFSNHLLRVRVKHVHQLQNLYFALTGEELTIIEEV